MYLQIKNKTSCYDTYQRNGLGKNIRINKNLFPVFRSKLTCCVSTYIEIELPDESVWYNDEYDYWPSRNDLRNQSSGSSSSFSTKGYMKPKTIFRKLQKWDLPEGSKVHVEYLYKYTPKGPTFFDEFNLTIKKR